MSVEEELRRLRAAVDVVPLGVVVAGDAGVVFRNRQARSLVGGRGTDAIAAHTVDTMLARESPDRTTLDLFGPPRRSLALSTEPLFDDEGSLGTIALIEDVTERRQLDAVRRDFVANVSHELRTPVGALGVLAETLAGEDDPAVMRRLCARISVEAERAARIIDDLLDLSRIEAGGAQSRADVAVADLFAMALERVRGAAERRGVSLVTAPFDEELRLVADESQLVSALANLLDNAVEYSDDGSSVELLARDEGEWIELVVRDSGIGIPHRDLERVFERFYRVDRARSRHTGGTGLGLSIVRHVATNHGGQVKVSSREGEGSTFTLRLPRLSP